MRKDHPELRGVPDDRVLAVVGEALRVNARGMGGLVGFAGRYAQERGRGPVQIGASTWAHRDAAGRTQLWHRKPTAAEVRACSSSPAVTPAGATTARAPKATASTERIVRLFA